MTTIDEGPLEVSEAFALCIELGDATLDKQGYEKLSVYPGVLKMHVDDRWTVKCHAQHGQQVDGLDPFLFYVEFNGWPAGIISVNGGIIAAGAIANEDALCKAVRERLLVEFGKEV